MEKDTKFHKENIQRTKNHIAYIEHRTSLRGADADGEAELRGVECLAAGARPAHHARRASLFRFSNLKTAVFSNILLDVSLFVSLFLEIVKIKICKHTKGSELLVRFFILVLYFSLFGRFSL